MATLAAVSNMVPPAEAAAPRPVRVLVVDDSAYIRLLISKHLAETPGLQVVGTARDGRDALDLIPRLQPDVVTLDVEMPRLDGLSTLREIMSTTPRPVIMLSALTTEGARETVQALTWGAVDFIAKPTSRANLAVIIDELVAKVRAAAGTRPRAVAAAPARAKAPAANKTSRPLQDGDRVVVIGASTGGPRALSGVVPLLPADLPAAVVIVQHMPAGFTRSLAERLDSNSALAVREAEPGDAPEVGRALLAPGGFHLRFDRHGRAALNQDPAVNGVRPAIDVTMTDVARLWGSAGLGVVLTGMGQDGAQGATLIHRAGGQVIAEDESTCVVWGMPRSVAEAGVADVVLPLPQIAAAIERMVRAA